MQRLTISVDACTESLGLLVAMAWADGRLDDDEKAGVRGAAQVFNLSKDSRDRIDSLLANAPAVEDAKVDKLSARDRAFAFVAAAWMAHVDGKLDPAEEKMLGEIGSKLDLGDARQKQLIETAKALDPLPEGKRSWSTEITRLFKAIPAEIAEVDGDFEVVFE
jgi:tellurite resistance protein